MTYIKVNDTLYSASISGKRIDRDWDGRESRSFAITMDYDDAVATFVNGVKWSIVEDVYNNEGTEITGQVKHDCSEFSVAGTITDNRNGTLTIKMGKPTDSETLAAVTAAYAEGVNSI